MMNAVATPAAATPTTRRLGAASRSGAAHAMQRATAGATKIRLRIDAAAKARKPSATRAGITPLGLGALHHVHPATAAAATRYPTAGSECVAGSHSVDASFSAELRKLAM